MRARYYSPELRRFINADIIAGEISNAITLNRYAYANGNPVSNVDPFGRVADERGTVKYKDFLNDYMRITENPLYLLIKGLGLDISKEYVNESITIVDILFGGVKANLSISVSHQLNEDAMLTLEETTSGFINYSSGIDFGSEDFTVSTGIYTDAERLAIGRNISAQFDEWGLSYKEQIGLYSDATILGMSYDPDEYLLPNVTISLDMEVNHLVELGAAATVISLPYAISAIPAAVSGLTSSSTASITAFITTAANFMAQAA